jgi:hypothetical protein
MMKRRRYIVPEMGIEAAETEAVMTPIVLAGSHTGPKVGNQAPKGMKAY